MNKPPRSLTLAATATFLTGCFGTLPTPLPGPEARADVDVRGVVLKADDGSEGERVRFSEILDVDWRDSSLSILGSRAGAGTTQPSSHEFAYDDLAGVLTRQVDTNRTSALIAAAILATVATVTLLVTGKTEEGTPIGGIR